MKWRNQLLALFCLALFAAGGVFYFRNWVVQKPYGIILFIGEGLDTRSLAAARAAARWSSASRTSSRIDQAPPPISSAVPAAAASSMSVHRTA